MRAVIFAIGTRGDVEPALALAWQLRSQGHDVRLGVPLDLVGFCRQTTLETVPVSVDAREFLQSPEGQRFLAAGDTKEYMRMLVGKKHEIAPAVHRDLTAAAEGADVIVATRLAEEEGSSLAEWLNVPFLALHYAPVRSNAHYPNPFVTHRRLPRPANLLTHRVFEKVQWSHNAEDVNRLRGRLGLRPVDRPASSRLARDNSTEIQAYSGCLVPELKTWSPRRPLTGYLRMGAEQRALVGGDVTDSALDTWLSAGEPPVYIGFGSQPILDGQALVDLVRAAAEKLDARVLLNAGWSDLPDDDPGARVMIRRAVNHDEVLPRCRAAVHHGGAGSTAASAGAGLPTLICADFADRGLWGRVLERRGIGGTVKLAGLTAPALVQALTPVLEDSPRRRARAVAASLAQEDGALQAARLVEQAVSTRRSAPASPSVSKRA